MPPTIRPIREDELVAWFGVFRSTFYIWPNDPEAAAAARRPGMELERTIGAFDGEKIVGTFRTFSTGLTLPGGARVDVNAVSGVSVLATHRRQGTLTRLAADDLGRATARGDAASILIAAEWPIYGRYGYGPATWQAVWSLRTRATRFLVDPVGAVEVIDPKTARQMLPAIYERCAAKQPGEIDRRDTRWDYDMGLSEVPSGPRWQGSVVVHRNDAGELDGYARFHGEERWEDGLPDHVLLLDDLRGETREAEIDLWRHLAQMDLTATIKAELRRPAEPVKWCLSDARAARVTGVADFLWLRLLDVTRVLGQRRYDRDGDVVLEVIDDVGEGSGPAAGTYRLTASSGAATCERTDAQPDLTIDVRALSAASLGGTRLGDATRSIAYKEHRPGALQEAEAMLLSVEPPWCSTPF